MIINRIYETQNLLSLQLVSFVVGLRTYQHLLYVQFCRLACRHAQSHGLVHIDPFRLRIQSGAFLIVHVTVRRVFPQGSKSIQTHNDMFSPPSEIAETASVAMSTACSGPMASFVFSGRKEQLHMLNFFGILLIHCIRILPKDCLGTARGTANLVLTHVTIY